MAGLISDSELAAIEEVTELAMQTPVAVLRYMRVERTDWDDQEFWVTTAITTAMLYSPPTLTAQPGVEGGIIGDPETLTCLIRKEIVVTPGDRIGVDGTMFNVVGANEFDTYSPSRILSLRRFE